MMQNVSIRKLLPLFTSICIVLLLLSAFTSAVQDPLVIEIQVAPATLNLGNQGTWVTVHTDIAYADVTAASVTLNGVAIDWSKSDNQGNFVAKFIIRDVKNLPLKIGEYNTLILCGLTTNGEAFSGSAEVKVVDVTG